jgi:hypothetical protein
VGQPFDRAIIDEVEHFLCVGAEAAEVARQLGFHSQAAVEHVLGKPQALEEHDLFGNRVIVHGLSNPKHR